MHRKRSWWWTRSLTTRSSWVPPRSRYVVARRRTKAAPKPPTPTGMKLVDGLADIGRPRIEEYVQAASDAVRESAHISDLVLPDGTKVRKAARQKAGQIRLSNALGRALAADLRDALPRIDAVA